MKLYIIRHGETVGNAGNVIQGHIGGNLSERGKLQARSIVLKANHIYSSDLNRAFETAQIISESNNIPLTKTFALREGSLGHLEGRPWKEFLRYDWNNPGLDMETIDYQIARLKLFLEKLYTKHKDETIILVTHSGTIKGLVSITRNITDYLPDAKTNNGSISTFSYDDKLKLIILNDCKHLPAELRLKKAQL